MDIITLNIIILLVFFMLSAYFSGTETALFSIKKTDLHRYALSSDSHEYYISSLMRSPQNVLITILIGNMFVNIIVSALSTSVLLSIWPNYGHIIAIALVTPIIIVLCEISPKVITINDYEKYSRKSVPMLRIFHTVFYPLRVVLLAFTNGLIRVFNLKLQERESITEDELAQAIKAGEKHGIISNSESEFIRNVLRFSKKEAENVMIPRNKAVFISVDADIDEATGIFLESGQVRVPVFKDDPDHIVGVLDARDLIPYRYGMKKGKKISRLMHTIDHYPASKELGELLAEFLTRQIQVAIVVDEYGGTAGVVSLPLIISELLGRENILWEDSPKNEIRKLDENITIIPGDMQLDDFNDKFNEKLFSEETETVAGFIIETLGHFPRRRETMVAGNYFLTVRNISRNSIKSIEIKNKN